MGLLSWMPPSLAVLIYTTVMKPLPIRLLVQAVVKRLIPPTIRIDNATLVLNQDDAIVSGALALGCYETLGRRFFASLLRPGQCVLDVGANIGLYTVTAAQRVGPTGRVIAIEPDPVNCSFLRQSVERNAMSNVTVVQAAVSNVNGRGRLYLNPLNKGRHCIYDAREGRRSVEVDLVRLDDLLHRLAVETVDVIKMDVEGAETLVLEGMPWTLAARDNLRVVMEFWPWAIQRCGGDPAALLAALRAAGFQIHELTDRQCVPVPPSDDARLLALRRERQRADLFLKRGGEGACGDPRVTGPRTDPA